MPHVLHLDNVDIADSSEPSYHPSDQEPMTDSRQNAAMLFCSLNSWSTGATLGQRFWQLFVGRPTDGRPHAILSQARSCVTMAPPFWLIFGRWKFIYVRCLALVLNLFRCPGFWNVLWQTGRMCSHFRRSHPANVQKCRDNRSCLPTTWYGLHPCTGTQHWLCCRNNVKSLCICASTGQRKVLREMTSCSSQQLPLIQDALTSLSPFKEVTRMVSAMKQGLGTTSPQCFWANTAWCYTLDIRGITAGWRGGLSAVSGPAGSLYNWLHPFEAETSRGVVYGWGETIEDTIVLEIMLTYCSWSQYNTFWLFSLK